MAEVQQQQEEEVEEEQPTSEESSDHDEGSEELKDVHQVHPSRALLSLGSRSSVDPDNDSPNTILYRKVRANLSLWLHQSERADGHTSGMPSLPPSNNDFLLAKK